MFTSVEVLVFVRASWRTTRLKRNCQSGEFNAFAVKNYKKRHDGKSKGIVRAVLLTYIRRQAKPSYADIHDRYTACGMSRLTKMDWRQWNSKTARRNVFSKPRVPPNVYFCRALI